MIQLELTNDEEQYLKEEVKTRLGELDHEIDHTDSMDFKEGLKRRQAALQKVLGKLPEAAAISA